MNGLQPLFRFACFMALAASFSGCSTFVSSVDYSDSSYSSISGSLSSRDSASLPRGGLIIVELTNPANGQVMAEQQLTPEDLAEPGQDTAQEHEQGQDQVPGPLPYSLKVAIKSLREFSDYTLRASIRDHGKTTWISDPVTVRPENLPVAGGTLLLYPSQPEALSSTLDCGEQSARVTTSHEDNQDKIWLTLANEKIALRPVISATGSRYVGIGVPATEVWFNEGKAFVTLRTDLWPDCSVSLDKLAAQ